MPNVTATTPLQDAASNDQDNVAEVRELTKYYDADIHALDWFGTGKIQASKRKRRKPTSIFKESDQPSFFYEHAEQYSRLG